MARVRLERRGGIAWGGMGGEAGLPLFVVGDLAIRSRSGPWGMLGPAASLEGARARVRLGAWAAFLPEAELKVLHSVGGLCHCRSEAAPSREEAFAWDDLSVARGRYRRSDWRAAFETRASRRVAENVLASMRLHAAGLGPEVKGIAVVRSLSFDGVRDGSGAFGFLVQDAGLLPAKAPATEAEVVAAGVRPDAILSCVRQQVGGWVVDLNSVIGAVPLDAEDEVSRLARRIEAALVP